MKKFSGFIFIIFLVQLVVLSSCKEEENKSPKIEILTPVDGDWAMQGDQIKVTIKAEDEDGSVEEVWFYINYMSIYQTTERPFEYLWTVGDSLVGDINVKVVARDNEGGASSETVTVVVDTEGGFNPNLSYGTLDDVDGNSYNTIEIGNQNWMAENLKATHYADGTPISHVADDAGWSNLGDTERAYCWYNNMSEYSDTTGTLYSWAGAMNGETGINDISGVVQGVCPDGWHLPDDADWKELEMHLGMSQAAADAYDWRGADEGGMLKEKGFSHWENPNSGATNTSGFTTLAGGFRANSGTFFGFGQYATFWTASEKAGSDNIWYRVLHFEQQRVYRHYNFRTQGLSVRCVEDQ
ncbi:MAG: hypothetical protein GY790_12815 [Bacteroidetes bacterium]|nr:hypothetical protein [Bacteroidota bacterium]